MGWGSVWNKVQNLSFCSEIGYIFRLFGLGCDFTSEVPLRTLHRKKGRSLFGASLCPVRCHCKSYLELRKLPYLRVSEIGYTCESQV